MPHAHDIETEPGRKDPEGKATDAIALLTAEVTELRKGQNRLLLSVPALIAISLALFGMLTYSLATDTHIDKKMLSDGSGSVLQTGPASVTLPLKAAIAMDASRLNSITSVAVSHIVYNHTALAPIRGWRECRLRLG